MAIVVGVHGIAQQLKGAQTLADAWYPAMADGVSLAAGALDPGDLVCAAYGHLFRPEGSTRSVGVPHFRPADVTGEEAELLQALWEHAAATDTRVVDPDVDVRLATPRSVQAALRALTRSKFFAGLAERAMIFDLKQVSGYLRDDDIRAGAIAAVDDAVTADTRVIVAHSLGTVVAFEALHLHADNPRWAGVDTLVTLGSPLGIPNVILHQLRPSPVDGDAWPGLIKTWTNISDDGDVVALVKELGPLWDGRIVDVRIDNGAKVHDVAPYLTDRRTGEAIAAGLP